MEPLAFVGVTVLAEDGTLQPDRTVLVRDGRIESIGQTRAMPVPADARRISGAGRYLVPGLIDMHIHPRTNAQLRRLALHGVTTARVMNGRPDLLRLRDRIMADALTAPELIVAGPILEGPPPQGYDDVIETGYRTLVGGREAGGAAVAEQAEAGYDLIKVYNNLDPETYVGIAEEAARRGLDVAGHVPFGVGIRGAIAAGQRTVEHLRGYVQEAVPADAPHQPGPDYRSRLMAWADADTLRFPDLARATAEAGVWNCPTRSTRTLLLPTRELVELLSSPAGHELDETERQSYLYRHRRKFFSNISEADLDVIARGRAKEDALVRALAAAGAPLCAGTDVAISGLELIRELDMLVAIGLTPAAALDAATGSAARALRRTDLGRVAVGGRADLLLLDDDPRTGLEALRRPAGIALRGRWLSRPTLDSLLELEAARDRSVIRVRDPAAGPGRTVGEGMRPQPVGGSIYYLSRAPADQRYVEIPRDEGMHRIARLMPLMVTDGRGGEPRRVIDRVLTPTLTRTYDVSPDGRRVVYLTVTAAGSPELRLLDLDSGSSRTVRALSNTDPIGPRFSPDGALIAFTDGPDLLIASAEPATSARRDGAGGPRRLARQAAWDGLVAWSATGDRVMALGYPPGSGGNVLYLVGLSGGEPLRLTPPEEDRYYKEGFAWHPDGSRVVYMCYCGNDHLRIAHLDGRPTGVFLDREESWDWMGVWSPDGGRYLFLGYGEEQGLFSFDPETGTVVRVGSGTEPPEFVPGTDIMVLSAPASGR